METSTLTGLNQPSPLVPDLRSLSPEQAQLVRELTETYELDAAQIAFEGESLDPIFDYEALNSLRLALTDIRDIDPSIEERDESRGIVTVKCRVVLSDGRTASALESAMIGEVMPNGRPIETLRQAQNVAQARALRRGIRSVGVNLLRAHRQFMLSGETQKGAVDAEFSTSRGREIHALATEWGHIRGTERSAYQDFIERIFGSGKRSSLDLSEIQRSQLATMYRSMLKARRAAME
jgi:hypothetical protein